MARYATQDAVVQDERDEIRFATLQMVKIATIVCEGCGERFVAVNAR